MIIENRTQRIIHLNVKDASAPGGHGTVSILPGDFRTKKSVKEANEVSDVTKSAIQNCPENALQFAGDAPALVCHGGALKFQQRKAA